MKQNMNRPIPNEIDALCDSVRTLVAEKRYEDCLPLICGAMETYPHAPQPHNLLGIVLEKLGDHPAAMKHFRAAWALDPTYLPASHNLHTYGTFFTGGRCAFDESDVPEAAESNLEVVYDARGIGHMVSKTVIQYDKHGIGHAVRR